jgi:Rrf2 family iron-sulfur cluster assembly transcriptional regulator
MTDLAMRQNTGPVALSTISARQGTSLSYLEQLFSALKRAGLVDSTRGPGGGYALAHKPEQVSVADIVVAVENHKPGEEAAPAAHGSSQMVSMTGSLWAAFNARVLEYLQSVTLRDLVSEQQARGVRVRWFLLLLPAASCQIILKPAVDRFESLRKPHEIYR